MSTGDFPKMLCYRYTKAEKLPEFIVTDIPQEKHGFPESL